MTTKVKPAKAKQPGTRTAGLLCGTDFSPTAGQAANVAVALAQRLQVPLELVHVSVIPAYPPIRKDLRAEAASAGGRGGARGAAQRQRRRGTGQARQS